MRNFLTVFCSLFVGFQCVGQHAEILRGASEFRKIVFENFEVNLQKIEKIRTKLDSSGLDTKDFYRFINNLNSVAKNLNKGSIKGRQYNINALKNSKMYRGIDEKELVTIIENLSLIYIPYFGIWEERYPHKIDVNSLRLKEIGQYGIEEGDRILHYHAMQSHLAELLFLSYDSIHISYNPFDFIIEKGKLFELVADSVHNSSNTLEYLFETYPKFKEDQLYDKVIFNCLGILFFRQFPHFNKKIKTIHKLLALDGEFIAGANYQTLMFDGPFPEIQEIDKKVERILKCGFVLKERIHEVGEYVVYKFGKI